ncbi:hypothetical protein PEPS_12070 [Persicobacter psychrovividus]|uniref:Uncharacterized protein n=1 Tax=Persicobacter psychrovividus TaxID=387638 RepID=A0ABN6L6T2_9BACT|nr:hypothetical protein PEPS_12070 [Persicobacter psychrovividus]
MQISIVSKVYIVIFLICIAYPIISFINKPFNKQDFCIVESGSEKSYRLMAEIKPLLITVGSPDDERR